MNDREDRRASATPYMKRLAASMRRSRDTIRTLPGQLSRSLAPSNRNRHRRRDLLLLLAAIVPFGIAVAVIGAHSGHGRWRIADVSSPPWLAAGEQGRSRLRTLIGESVHFDRGRVRAPVPLACDRARYRELELPPQAAFQGVLSGRMDIATQLAGLGMTGAAISTLRVDCDNASFDYHRTGDGLVVLIDGRVLRLSGR